MKWQEVSVQKGLICQSGANLELAGCVLES